MVTSEQVKVVGARQVAFSGGDSILLLMCNCVDTVTWVDCIYSFHCLVKSEGKCNYQLMSAEASEHVVE